MGQEEAVSGLRAPGLGEQGREASWGKGAGMCKKEWSTLPEHDGRSVWLMEE